MSKYPQLALIVLLIGLLFMPPGTAEYSTESSPILPHQQTPVPVEYHVGVPHYHQPQQSLFPPSQGYHQPQQAAKDEIAVRACCLYISLGEFDKAKEVAGKIKDKTKLADDLMTMAEIFVHAATLPDDMGPNTALPKEMTREQKREMALKILAFACEVLFETPDK